MPRPRTRITLDAGARLSLKGVRLEPRTTRQIEWRIGDLEVFGLLCLLDNTGFVSIRFAGKDQKIGLIAEPRHFGGLQWFFYCPITGHRATVLWRPQGADWFASRQAFKGASYHSQAIGVVDRAWREKRKVAKALGSDDPADHDLQPRPLWMRKRTYGRLVLRYAKAHRRIMREFEKREPALMARFQKGQG